MKNNLLLIVFLHFFIIGISQSSLTNQLDYEVNRVYPAHSITKENLKKVSTLMDLNEHYKPSWVRTYISVEIEAILNGQISKVIGKNENLNQEQKDLLNEADVNQAISIVIKYIPENTLKNNPPKEIDFTLNITPTKEASFVGGNLQLNKYLKENAIDIISVPDFFTSKYNFAVVKFTIDELGQIINTQLVESSKDDTVDELLVETISNMPNWQPGEYGNGIKVKQEFVLTVGNHENCTINLLNIRRD